MSYLKPIQPAKYVILDLSTKSVVGYAKDIDEAERLQRLYFMQTKNPTERREIQK